MYMQNTQRESLYMLQVLHEDQQVSTIFKRFYCDFSQASCLYYEDLWQSIKGEILEMNFLM